MTQKLSILELVNVLPTHTCISIMYMYSVLTKRGSISLGLSDISADCVSLYLQTASGGLNYFREKPIGLLVLLAVVYKRQYHLQYRLAFLQRMAL